MDFEPPSERLQYRLSNLRTTAKPWFARDSETAMPVLSVGPTHACRLAPMNAIVQDTSERTKSVENLHEPHRKCITTGIPETYLKSY